MGAIRARLILLLCLFAAGILLSLYFGFSRGLVPALFCSLATAVTAGHPGSCRLTRSAASWPWPGRGLLGGLARAVAAPWAQRNLRKHRCLCARGRPRLWPTRQEDPPKGPVPVICEALYPDRTPSQASTVVVPREGGGSTPKQTSGQVIQA